MFSSLGFPGFMGPITGIAEVIAGILFVLGLYPRWSSLVFLVVMAGAISGVHLPASFAAGSPTPALERDLLIAAGVIVTMSMGFGAISLGASQRSSRTAMPQSEFE